MLFKEEPESAEQSAEATPEPESQEQSAETTPEPQGLIHAFLPMVPPFCSSDAGIHTWNCFHGFEKKRGYLLYRKFLI